MIDYRNAQDIQPLNDEMSKSYLYKKNKEDEESSVRIAYTLAKQSEMRKQKELDFWRNVQLLR